jgi:hypothetical protein
MKSSNSQFGTAAATFFTLPFSFFILYRGNFPETMKKEEGKRKNMRRQVLLLVPIFSN